MLPTNIYVTSTPSFTESVGKDKISGEFQEWNSPLNTCVDYLYTVSIAFRTRNRRI